LNIVAAKKFGWKSVHLVEPSVTAPPELAGDHQISNLQELRDIFPEVFKNDG